MAFTFVVRLLERLGLRRRRPEPIDPEDGSRWPSIERLARFPGGSTRFLMRGRRAIWVYDDRVEGAEWPDPQTAAAADRYEIANVVAGGFATPYFQGVATSWREAEAWLTSGRQSDLERFPFADPPKEHQMTEWPTVAIVLLTYEPGGDDPRRTAETTLRNALSWIRYSGPLDVHIADDGSEEAHRAHLAEIAGGYEHVQNVGVTNAERGGYGKSYNLAMQAVHAGAEIILPLEDDWELLRPLDLNPLVETLVDPTLGIDCLRLGYIGWTQEVRGELLHTPADTVFLFDPESSEPHVFAGHPRLETRDFERAIGPWTEGLPAGATEFDVSQRPEARVGVGFPLDLIHPRGDLFAHIGARELGEIVPEGAVS